MPLPQDSSSWWAIIVIAVLSTFSITNFVNYRKIERNKAYCDNCGYGYEWKALAEDHSKLYCANCLMEILYEKEVPID